jgi:hypothetical protein
MLTNSGINKRPTTVKMTLIKNIECVLAFPTNSKIYGFIFFDSG